MNRRWRWFAILLTVATVGTSLSYATKPVQTYAEVSNPANSSESALLTPGDFRHFSRFAKQLAKHTDLISQYIWTHISPATQALIGTYLTTGESEREVREALAQDLNRLLRDPGFYEPSRFSQMHQRGTTRRLLEKRGHNEDIIVLNRAALENAYPGEISISVVGKVFEDATDGGQEQADQAQSQADQQQQQADDQQQQAGAQQDQQQADQQQQQADQQQAQADQSQAQADQAQAQVDQANQAAVAGQVADQGQGHGWTWGEFFSAIFAGIAGGAAGGATGGFTGAVVGGAVGALVGAAGYLSHYFGGGLIQGGGAVLPARALDGPILDGRIRADS